MIVADDHAAVRRGLVDFFEAQDGITVVGEAVNGRDALERCCETLPAGDPHDRACVEERAR